MLQLTPEEWLLAPWRERVVQPRPAERPFRRKDASTQLRKLLRAWPGAGAALPWDVVEPRMGLSEEEAAFWLDATARLYGHPALDAAGCEAFAREWRFSRVPSVDELLAQPIPRSAAFLVFVERLHGLEGVGRAVREGRELPRYGSDLKDDTFRTGLLPYLTDAELRPLREALRVRLRADYPQYLLLLAIRLGEREAVEQRCPSTPDSVHHADLPFVSCETLGRCTAFTARDVVAWLAHTGIDRLDELTETILKRSSAEARPMVKVLTERVTSPVLAPCLIRLLAKNRGAEFATAWLEADAERARAGLSGVVFPKKNRAALEALAGRWLTPQSAPAPEGIPLDALRGLSLERPVPLPWTDALRREGDPAELDAFTLGLVDEWAAAGAPPKERWVLSAAAVLGGDRTALRLLELQQTWRQRMTILKLGYRALEQLASPAVLWRARQMKEQRFLADVAELRGIDEGTLLDGYLPREGDAVAIRKAAQERLEYAWFTSGRWTRDAFERQVLGHPFVCDAGRLVVWGVLDRDERWRGFFRISEDLSLAGVDEREFAWPEEGVKVGLPRPYELGAVRAAWFQILADYQVIPLLQQFLAVESATPPQGDRLVAVGSSSTLKVGQQLEKLGWAFGHNRFRRRLPSEGLTVTAWPDSLSNEWVFSFDQDGVGAISARQLSMEALSAVLTDCAVVNLEVKEAA